MSSPISFGGKCLTVFIGAALSWMTIANPEVDVAVGRILGMQHDQESKDNPVEAVGSNVLASSSLTDAVETKAIQGNGLPDVDSLVDTTPTADTVRSSRHSVDPSAMNNVPSRLVASQPTSQQHVSQAAAPHQASNGTAPIQEIASQLKSLGATYVLLERLPQAASDQYRARCDLAGNGNSVKCCFEAVRSTPREAMEDVLREVVSRRDDSTNSRVNDNLASPPI